MLDQVDFIVQNSGSNATPDDDAVYLKLLFCIMNYLFLFPVRCE